MGSEVEWNCAHCSGAWKSQTSELVKIEAMTIEDNVRNSFAIRNWETEDDVMEDIRKVLFWNVGDEATS